MKKIKESKFGIKVYKKEMLGEKEFNFKKEMDKWYDKWLHKKLTGRAIFELGTIRKEFIKRLKKKLLTGYLEADMKMINEVDKLAGDDLI